jgi:hypothetical protein
MFIKGEARAGKRPDKVAGRFLAYVLRNEGWSLETFAGRCGVTPGVFKYQRGAGFPSRRLRWRIEAALDYRAVWSTDQEVQLGRRCWEMFGCDPRLIPLPQLRALCRRLEIQPPTVRQRERWIENLRGWIASHNTDPRRFKQQKD